MKWRSVIKHDVVKWIGNDLGDPDQPGLHILDDEQLHGAEQQCTESDHQPDHAHVAQEVGLGGVVGEDAEQRGVKPEHGGR